MRPHFVVSAVRLLYAGFYFMNFICKECGNSFVDKKHLDRQYCSKSCSKKGKINKMWRGEKVQYHALHAWVKRNNPEPANCECCGKEAKLDAANISNEYKREITDWEWLCRSCHMKKDGRMNNITKNHKQTIPDKICPICDKVFHSSTRRVKYCSRTCYIINQRRLPYIPFGANAKKGI